LTNELKPIVFLQVQNSAWSLSAQSIQTLKNVSQRIITTSALSS
jgi:hypothetical protein